MPDSGIVKLVKLTLSPSELEKLSPLQKKRYVMFTSILRDLMLLQKHLMITGNDTPSSAPEAAAHTTSLLYFLSTLISKIHEMWFFLNKNGIVDERETFSSSLASAFDPVEELLREGDVADLFSFVRNKFGFHYEYWDDVDDKIDRAIASLDGLEMYLSSDSGNDIYSSSNTVITAVIMDEMKLLGYTGSPEDLLLTLWELTIDAAGKCANFSRAYLAEALPVTWEEHAEIEIEAPRVSDISVPLLISKD